MLGPGQGSIIRVD